MMGGKHASLRTTNGSVILDFSGVWLATSWRHVAAMFANHLNPKQFPAMWRTHHRAKSLGVAKEAAPALDDPDQFW